LRLRGRSPMTQRQHVLSQALRCTPRNVTDLVDALEAAGLVVRGPASHRPPGDAGQPDHARRGRRGPNAASRRRPVVRRFQAGHALSVHRCSFSSLLTAYATLLMARPISRKPMGGRAQTRPGRAGLNSSRSEPLWCCAPTRRRPKAIERASPIGLRASSQRTWKARSPEHTGSRPRRPQPRGAANRLATGSR
jgi:hypothetical protein